MGMLGLLIWDYFYLHIYIIIINNNNSLIYWLTISFVEKKLMKGSLKQPVFKGFRRNGTWWSSETLRNKFLLPPPPRVRARSAVLTAGHLALLAVIKVRSAARQRHLPTRGPSVRVIAPRRSPDGACGLWRVANGNRGSKATPA